MNQIMKTILIAGAAIILAFASIASSAELSGAEITNLRWDAANINALRALDKAAVVILLDNLAETASGTWIPSEDDILSGFTWVDLAGDGRYELLAIYHSRCCSVLYIYWQDAPGKVSVQGYSTAGELDKTIRDLNGDGKRELVLYAYLKSSGPGVGPTAMWPQVYRLQNGSYVEASRDFPSFYDTEVLPQLEHDIGKARESPRDQAVLVMERDKILRVLGRDPNAGLAQAREWVKSPDSRLVADARVVFDDIGGHEQELNAAKLRLKSLRERLPRKDW